MRNIILVLLMLVFSSCHPAENSSYSSHKPRDEINHYQVDDNFKKEVIFNRSPRALKYWISPPNITLCPETSITRDRLRRAIRFWERLGYEIGNVRIISKSHNCTRDPLHGEVMITLFNNKTPIGLNLAVTHVSFYKKTSEIISAKVSILPAHSNKEWILEHEIGHALGWSHFSRKGHIMNPNYEFLGSDSHGLRYATYLKMIGEIIIQEN